MAQDIAERVRGVIQRQLGVEPDRAADEARLDSDLDADSLDCVELLMSLEEEFDVEISDDEGTKIETVGDAIRLVAAKLNAEQPA
jgi:acyl carrier protein